MKWIKFLLTKTFWINLGLIFLSSIIIVLIVFKWLNIHTKHGEYITLNDFTGLSAEQTIQLLEDKKLTYEIIDTNAINVNLPPHSIAKQDPKPLDKVKEGRTVYLWLTTNIPKKRLIPDLAGKSSLDEGIFRLQNANFVIGEIIEKPSDDEGAILELLVDDIEVNPGQMAYEGDTIQIVVGGGLGGSRIPIPCLIGRTLLETEVLLSANDLVLGHVNYGSDGLADTASAVIYKQMPNVNQDFIRVGEPVDVFLKQELPYDVNKCVEDSLR